MQLPKLQNVVIESAPDGALGFDVNHPISLDQAKQAFQSGFSFCIRYVPRLELSVNPVGSNDDITFEEANHILDSGLALFLVQHVSNNNWVATSPKGMRYGKNAAVYAANCGFPPGMNIFLDLEEVNSASPPNDIQGFCNEWFDAVIDFGYLPGVYVGSKNGLNADQLFSGTKFEHYWHAASQTDPPTPRPGDRGYQLFQPLNLRSAQISKLKNVKLIDTIGLGKNPAFEINLKFDSTPTLPSITIEDVDLDFTATDKKGGNIQWIRR
ncbi:DUF1906 domain-containing protein [Nostoc sp.]|uniref:DUF1906 domain-containing protein n=1 Tax=Nostoc sp. TaxID=1180 RepID=UPI002FFC4E13